MGVHPETQRQGSCRSGSR
ncbi:hypothetical protein P4O66_013170 [Electrophorus voltai]|uniref:Uncharacterized protein n=1 Tax=Electrophorus voltai TaxID=2609070 RepID=A0AAD8Z265_9TELE|nr:hypothetical protein P4O66_013170 [Electrophorus voltai]